MVSVAAISTEEEVLVQGSENFRGGLSSRLLPSTLTAAEREQLVDEIWRAENHGLVPLITALLLKLFMRGTQRSATRASLQVQPRIHIPK